MLDREVGDIGPLAEALLGDDQQLLVEVLDDLHADDLVVALEADGGHALRVAADRPDLAPP